MSAFPCNSSVFAPTNFMREPVTPTHDTDMAVGIMHTG